MRELEAFIERPFPSHSALVFARSCSDFEVQGSSLWNAATKIIRDVGDDDEFGPKPDLLRFGVLLRAFAFFMVDAASSVSPNRSKGCDERVRNFKVALKASRSCLESGDLQLTSKIIEAASKYIAAWEETIPMIHVADSAMGDEKSAIHRLISDFYLLRMAHASKSGRHDLSDHFFSKANINGQASDEDLLETAAGHCLEIGRLQLQSKSEENAVLWLERAYELLNSDALALRSLETEDLRLAIVAALIEALPFDDPGDRAWGLVLGLEQEHGLGDRNIVLIMQLNVLTRKGSADIDTAATILSRMVRCTVLTDQTYLT